MKRDFWESMVFLTVGFLALFHGAGDLIEINYTEASIWSIIGSLFRFVIGLMAVILGFRGLLRSQKS